MSEVDDPRNKFDVPTEDLGRQAVRSLGGYAYQLYQSLVAWVRLTDGGLLFLETAEDFATLVGNVLTQTQVKETKSSEKLTLNAASVAKHIDSHWRLQNANPEKHIISNFLATAQIGQEQRMSFPDGQGGLDYWNTAGRAESDIAPLKEALLQLSISDELKQFISNATSEEVKRRVIRPIRWLCGSADLTLVRQSMSDALVYFGEQRGVSSVESERTEHYLFGELLLHIVTDPNRCLSRADFIRKFEAATLVSVPTSLLRSLKGFESPRVVGAETDVESVEVIPLPSSLSSRSNLTHDLSNVSKHRPVLWLHGSSGVGKTTLALSFAKSRESGWLFVNLRRATIHEVRLKLSGAIRRLANESTKGVVVDDYPIEHGASVALNLAHFISELQAHNLTLVVTSSRPPTADFLFQFQDNLIAIVPVPYLAKEEVEEVIAASGGDTAQFTEFVYYLSQGGHPQLVAAIVGGLRYRKWPTIDLQASTWSQVPGVSELQEHRDRIVLQLVDELPENARDLLYRLSLATGGFDRTLALAISEAGKLIERAGEAFTILYGPWIEARGEELYEVSPLVSESGLQNLTKFQQSAVRMCIIKHLLSQDPFPAERLYQLLVNAYVEQDKVGLSRFAFAMLHHATRDKETFVRLAHIVHAFAAFGTGNSRLCPSDRFLSALLRIIQCLVAVVTDDTRSGELFGLVLADCRSIPDKTQAASLRVLGTMLLLGRRSQRLVPRDWFPAILSLSGDARIAADWGVPQHVISPDGVTPWNLDQFLFVAQSSVLPDIDSLVNLCTLLNDLGQQKRAHFLNAFNSSLFNIRGMVESAWFNESKKGTLNGPDAVEKFSQIRSLVSEWNHSELNVELLCAESLMLDEFCDDGESALALLESAIQAHPMNYRLLRRKQAVLFQQGDFTGSLDLLSMLKDAPSLADPIERMSALRDGARSAIEVGELGVAASLFEQAHDAVVDNMLYPLRVGLLADAAIAHFLQQNHAAAVALLKRALIESEQLDADLNASSRYRLIILGTVIVWMRQRTGRFNVDIVNLVPGVCSQPQVDDFVMSREVPPEIIKWYQLAELETDLATNEGCLHELRARTGEQKFVFHEELLAVTLLSSACRKGDVAEFFKQLPNFIAVSAAMRNVVATVQRDDILNPYRAAIDLVPDDAWTESSHLQVIISCIIAFGICALNNSRFDRFDQLLDRLPQTVKVEPSVETFLNLLRGDGQALPQRADNRGMASCLALCRLHYVDGLGPERTLIVNLTLWDWLRNSAFGGSIDREAAVYVTNLWSRVVSERKTALRQPSINVPLIEDAIMHDTPGLGKIARLALAAEHATSVSISGFQHELSKFVSGGQS